MLKKQRRRLGVFLLFFFLNGEQNEHTQLSLELHIHEDIVERHLLWGAVDITRYFLMKDTDVS